MEIAQVRVTWDYPHGSPGVSTLHFRKSTSSQWSELANQTVAFVLAAFDEFRAFFPTDLEYTVQGEIDILEDTTGELQYTINGTSVAHSGTDTSGFAPSPAGISVRYLTDGVNSGVRVRGRTYLVPVGNSCVDTDGTPTSGAITAAQAFGDAMVSVGSYVRQVIYSRKSAKNATGSSYDTTTASVKDQFAVLRSRRD